MGWVNKIHNCPTPSAADVEREEAQVGSVWECEVTPPGGSEPCGDRWKLRQIKGPPQVSVLRQNYPDWQRLTLQGEPIPGTASSAE